MMSEHSLTGAVLTLERCLQSYLREDWDAFCIFCPTPKRLGVQFH